MANKLLKEWRLKMIMQGHVLNGVNMAQTSLTAKFAYVLYPRLKKTSKPLSKHVHDSMLTITCKKASFGMPLYNRLYEQCRQQHPHLICPKKERTLVKTDKYHYALECWRVPLVIRQTPVNLPAAREDGQKLDVVLQGCPST